MTGSTMKRFVPKKPAPQGTRVERILCLDVGMERKARFVEYCEKHGVSQTEMIKQMIDYCVSHTEEQP